MKSDLLAELGRISGVPVGAAPPVLAVFTVKPYGSVHKYVVRLRELISAALEIARKSDFDEDCLSISSLPGWFEFGLQGDRRAGPEVLLGKDRYFQSRPTEGSWDAQEWISCFDPRLRRWEWWDLTSDDLAVSLWINTKSEPTVPLEEVWWALFISGAEGVVGPTMKLEEDWQISRSAEGKAKDQGGMS